MCTQTLNRSVQDINNYLSTFQLETVQSAFLKGTVSIISRLSMQRWQCPIHNITFNSLVYDYNFENFLFSIVYSLQKRPAHF